MPFFTHLNKKIYFSIKNPDYKNALLFIHGSGEHSFVWDNQVKDLNLNLKIIAIDLPSHGKSEKFKDLSLDLYVDVIKTLKKELKIENLILCGHSLGGAIAQDYYFKYPNDINSLILCSTGAKLRVLPVILHNSINNFEKFLENVPIGAFYKKTDERLKKSYVEELAKIKPIVVHNDFKICDNFNVLSKIHSIKVPCLIIVGDADKLTPIKYSKYFNKKIKNSTLKIINNAGHSVMIERPNKVTDAIESFIINNINS